MGQNYFLSFIDDGLYPELKEMIKETVELLSVAFREFKQLLSCSSETPRSFYSVRKVPMQYSLFISHYFGE